MVVVGDFWENSLGVRLCWRWMDEIELGFRGGDGGAVEGKLELLIWELMVLSEV